MNSQEILERQRTYLWPNHILTFEETRRRGLLIGKGGLLGNVVRVSPPLTATKEDVDEALALMDLAFAHVHEEMGVS